MGELHQLLSRGEHDERLVARVRSGDRVAEQQLFREHAPYIARVVASLIGGRQDVADVVQEVFLTAFQKLHTVEDPRGLRSWLTGIAIRKSSNARRARGRRWWQVLFSPETMPRVPGSSTSPEDRELLTATDRVLERMTDENREVFVLRIVEEMELTEVAAAIGVSLATVKRRVAAARAEFTELAARDPVLSVGRGDEP